MDLTSAEAGVFRPEKGSVPGRMPQRFSIARFVVLIVLQVAVLFFAVHLLFPGFWQQQLRAGALAIVTVFVSFHLFLSFFEWFFHRYVLHIVTASWLGKFAKEHRLHH